jgi:trk system potassium uptake protein TrkH
LGFVVLESRQGSTRQAENRRNVAVMRDASLGGRILDAFFLSVTCRTAGFNTVQMDDHSLSPESHTLAALLMFIGGSPASTAGGVKTVGLAVLCLGVLATMRGRRNVEAFGRTIPEMIIRRAAAIAFVMVLLVGLAAILLMYTESVSMREAVFESVSACGTVGLSTGLTPDLTVAGRLVIIAAMFAGRLGPLTLLIALAGPSAQPRYEYPAEQVTIG